MIRMASLAVVGSHAVNGVAALHTQLLISDVFPEFARMFPTRFCNQTNGVTPRRWLHQCNPGLASLITKKLDSSAWVKNLSLLQGLRPLADDKALQQEWMRVKEANKVCYYLYIVFSYVYNMYNHHKKISSSSVGATCKSY